MFNVLGIYNRSGYDRNNLDKYYGTGPLTDREAGEIFHTLCRVSSLWLLVIGSVATAVGGGHVLKQTHKFSLSTLPSLTLGVSGLMVWHASFDINEAGSKARQIVTTGLGSEDGETPEEYILYRSSYPRLCASLIERVKVRTGRPEFLKDYIYS